MAKTAHAPLRLCLIYEGGPPVHWTGGPAAFGLQDTDNRLQAPRATDGGAVAFDFDVALGRGTANLTGRFVHGRAGERFVYLAWRNADGAYAQRFKVPLGTITADHIDRALATGAALTARLIVGEQRATRTGANIGGTRPVVWDCTDRPADAATQPGADTPCLTRGGR